MVKFSYLKKGGNKMKVTIDNLHWQSDWNGYELGFPDVHCVGLYFSIELNSLFYINYEDSKVLAIMSLD